MPLQKLSLIDKDGFYLEDFIREIPETLEEAKQLNFPIHSYYVDAPVVEIEDPEDLINMRSRLKDLQSLDEEVAKKFLPGEIEQIILNCRLQIHKAEADLEARRKAASEQVAQLVEEFTIPPIVPNLIDVPIDKPFHRPKWNGSKWVEGLTKAEIKIATTAVPFEDWEGLSGALRGTELFAKAMMTTNANAFSLLLTTLAVVRHAGDLTFAIDQVRAGLPKDYTAEEIKSLGGLLTQFGFSEVAAKIF